MIQNEKKVRQNDFANKIHLPKWPQFYSFVCFFFWNWIFMFEISWNRRYFVWKWVCDVKLFVLYVYEENRCGGYGFRELNLYLQSFYDRILVFLFYLYCIRISVFIKHFEINTKIDSNKIHISAHWRNLIRPNCHAYNINGFTIGRHQYIK